MTVEEQATEGEVDRTVSIPRGLVACLWVVVPLVPLAMFAGGQYPVLWPLCWASVTATGAVLVLRKGSVPSRRLGRWVTPVGTIAVVAVLMGTGGGQFVWAYTWGSTGDLSLTAMPDVDPLDLSDGANHTVTVELRNIGTTAVRVTPYLQVGVEDDSGEGVYGGSSCPPFPRDLQYVPGFAGGKDLAPGAAFQFEVTLRSNGSVLQVDCDRWQVTASETYLMHATIEGLPRSDNLPTWTGSVQSNRVEVHP